MTLEAGGSNPLDHPIMKSMTGMGRSQGPIGDSHFRIEIRSINHRFCEVNVRLPSRLGLLEIPLQQHIKKKISRGKVDVSIFEDRLTQAATTEKKAFELYYQYLKTIQTETQIPGTIELRDLLPNVHAWMQKDVDTVAVLQNILPLIDQALGDLDHMRQNEGLHLKSLMQTGISTIKTLTHKIAEKTKGSAEEIEVKLKEKLEAKLKDFEKLDAARLHSEVIYYFDRLDITEELQRVESHFKQVANFFSMSEPAGRKLDFLLQEFNREFNTMASKSQDTEIAHWVVDAKAELEKIREQIQNVE